MFHQDDTDDFIYGNEDADDDYIDDNDDNATNDDPVGQSLKPFKSNKQNRLSDSQKIIFQIQWE